jgi:hypothetical protein
MNFAQQFIEVSKGKKLYDCRCPLRLAKADIATRMADGGKIGGLRYCASAISVASCLSLSLRAPVVFRL